MLQHGPPGAGNPKPAPGCWPVIYLLQVKLFMICAFSPSSVSGCESLAIKHAVSGLCCVWVLALLGCPGPSSGGAVSGGQDQHRAPAAFQGPSSPSPWPGRHCPTPECQGGTCSHARAATRPTATPPLPGAPAHCRYCDIDTTASGHREKE